MRRLLALLATGFVAAFVWSAVSIGPSRAGPAETLPVPLMTIYPGDMISASMLADRDFPAGTSIRYPVVAASSILVGKVARRTLLPGKLIPSNAVAEPDLVSRGSLTRAIFRDGGLVMTTLVLPLQNGVLGAYIQVRNVDSGQVIAGRVEADGTIAIGAQ